jgi:hypothetical protein
MDSSTAESSTVEVSSGTDLVQRGELASLLLRRLEQACVLDGDGGVAGQGLEQSQPPRGESMPLREREAEGAEDDGSLVGGGGTGGGGGGGWGGGGGG